MSRVFTKVILILSVLLLACAQPSLAASKDNLGQDAQFNEWMTYYYLHKDTEKFKELLQWLQTSQILEKNSQASAPMAAFLSIVFADNKQTLESWFQNPSFTGKTKETLQYALWLSGNGKFMEEKFKETPTCTETPPVNLMTMPLKGPADLDMMWGAFMASGDDRYVKKIVNVLDEDIPLTGDKVLDTATRASADWSLGSNMMEHELVNRLIHKEIAARSGAVKKKLEEMVARNKKEAKPFPNREGDFSAMMVVIDEKALTEFDKPSSEGLSIEEASSVKRGDTLAIKIVFAGMELTNDLMSDVTFDLKIFDPNGDIYDEADLKGVEALKSRIPKRFSVFDNQSFIKILFEPDDKLGKYQFVATIHDNIAKKSILLKKEVTLIQ